MPDEAKIAAVRAALPATGAGIYLNAGSVGPLPAETARAMSEVADRELQVGRASYADYLDTLDRRAEARAAVAAILSADIDTVALTHSTTDGLNIAATGHDWRPGDRAVTTNREHVGGVAPLLALAESRGVEVELVNVGVGADEAAILAAFDRAIDERTRVVSFSHVLWSTGAVMPVRAIADLAHERGAFVLVDGAQAPGAIAVDVGALGVDAYGLSAQKWLLGPEGMGALWVSQPTEMRSTPVSAIAGAVLRFTRPEASPMSRPSIIATPFCKSPSDILSSRTASMPTLRASSSCASVSTSTSILTR